MASVGGAAGALAAQAAVQKLVKAVERGNVAELKTAANALSKQGGPGEGGTPEEAVRAVRDSMGRGMLHYAAQFGQLHMMEHLVKACKLDVNAQDSKGETPLALAAAMDHHEAVALLLGKLGADPALRQHETATAAVHRAAAAGKPGQVAPKSLALLLDDPRVQVNTPSKTGTPLCWAADAGHVGAVKLLLTKGADVNDTGGSDSGMAPLMHAVGAGSPPGVAALLQAGADVRARAQHGTTALHVVASVQGPSGGDRAACEIATALLKAGADPDAKDSNGLTPLELAVGVGHQALAALLLPATAALPGVEPWTLQGLKAHVDRLVAERRAAGQAPVGGAAEGAGGASQGVVVAIPDPEEPDADKAATFKRQGDVAFVARDYAAAAEAYSQSLRHDTRSAVVWANRAAAYLKLERAQEALVDAHRSRALDATYAKAWYREGAALEMLGKWEDAAGAYYEGCVLTPDNKEFEAAFRRAIQKGREEHQAKQQQLQR